MDDASRLKSIREALGESQEVFAKRFGVYQSTVHRWETNGIPPRGMVRATVTKFIADHKHLLPEEVA